MKFNKTFAALATAVAAALAPGARAIRGVDQAVLALEKANASQLNYPTQFTQNIVPKQIHSHNDYWRDVPLLEALSYGVSSVEADVAIIDGTIYITHEQAALTTARTFADLYVDPLRKILDGQNPVNKFNPTFPTSPNGVWDTSSGTPLHLFVDIKTDGVEALPYILKALEPLRERGYLTTYANGTLTQSAVTVIGTGNSPLAQVAALEPRDYFYDAPLDQLTNTTLFPAWNLTIAPVASTDWAAVVGWSGIGNISADGLANLTRVVSDAHARGIAARFWDTPGWPIFARENVWRVLLENGADWLNADDLAAAAAF